MKITYLLFPIILGFYCLFPSSPLKAQTGFYIEGRVFDAESQQALGYVAVRFCGEMYGALTNEVGEFRLFVPTESVRDTLCISSIGYDTGTFPIQELEGDRIHSFPLVSSPFFADSVYIEGEKGKLPPAKNLVKRALRRILLNYSQDPFTLTGYYRDYIREDTGYVNLLEAALTLWDPGFKSDILQKGQGEILQTRYRSGIRIDSNAQQGYGQGKKIVPSYVMPEYGGNEFTILQAHDPVRNYNIKSFSFVYRLVKDFVPNHLFEFDRIIVQGGVPIYQIGFTLNKDRLSGFPKVRKSKGDPVRGTIWIRSDTYGIVKMNYLNFFEDSLDKKRYEITVEYQEARNKLFLKYISMNNFFELEDTTQAAFQVQGVRFEEKKNRFILRFNRMPTPGPAKTSRFFTVIYKEKEYEVRQSGLVDSFSIFLYVPGIREVMDMDMEASSESEGLALKKERLKELLLLGTLRFEIDNWLYDRDNIPFGGRPRKAMYQFREFFVNEIDFPAERPFEEPFDKLKPIFEQQKQEGSQFWESFTIMLNTPLKE